MITRKMKKTLDPEPLTYDIVLFLKEGVRLLLLFQKALVPFYAFSPLPEPRCHTSHITFICGKDIYSRFKEA